MFVAAKVMKFFDQLGSLPEQRWRAHDFDV